MTETIQQHGQPKGLVARAKAMIVTPATEWPAIAGEGSSVTAVLLRYVLPLAAIGPLAQLIGGQVFGYSQWTIRYRPSFTGSIVDALTDYLLDLAALFLVALVAHVLAPRFGGRVGFAAAFKWCAYAATAMWLVGIIGLVPPLWILAILGLYSLYLLHLGTTPMMGVPPDKAAIYTAVTAFCAAVLLIVAGGLAGEITSRILPAAPFGDLSEVEYLDNRYG